MAEGMPDHDERIWSEILERSLSSNSLHHLQRLQRCHDDDEDELQNVPVVQYHRDKRRNGNPPCNWDD